MDLNLQLSMRGFALPRPCSDRPQHLPRMRNSRSSRVSAIIDEAEEGGLEGVDFEVIGTEGLGTEGLGLDSIGIYEHRGGPYLSAGSIGRFNEGGDCGLSP